MLSGYSLYRRAAAVSLLAMTAFWPAVAQGPAAVLLFRVTGLREDVTIGLTAAQFEAMGPTPGVERLARKLVADGQLTAWRYAVGRAADGSTRFAAAGCIAILRNDALRIEPYTAALPIVPPPAAC